VQHNGSSMIDGVGRVDRTDMFEAEDLISRLRWNLAMFAAIGNGRQFLRSD
jgi:hypothetical protein